MSGPNYAGYPGVRGYQAPFELMLRIDKIVGDKVTVTFFHSNPTSTSQADLSINQFQRGDIEEGEGHWFWYRREVGGVVTIERCNISPSVLEGMVQGNVMREDTLDYKCSSCGVGINHGEETFNGKKTQVYCKACSRERRKSGADIADVVALCIAKLAIATGCDLTKELDQLNELSK